MNVKDFDVPVPDGDFLGNIFTKQLILMRKYHEIEEKNLGRSLPLPPLDINDRESQLRIKEFLWRITEEFGEAANCLKNKPWKTTPQVTDEVHFLEELIDAFHFTIELFLMLGFTPKSLTQLYLNKNAVNEFRIESKY